MVREWHYHVVRVVLVVLCRECKRLVVCAVHRGLLWRSVVFSSCCAGCWGGGDGGVDDGGDGSGGGGGGDGSG